MSATVAPIEIPAIQRPANIRVAASEKVIQHQQRAIRQLSTPVLQLRGVRNLAKLMPEGLR